MLQLEISTDWLAHYNLRGSEAEILDFLKRNPLIVFVLQLAPRHIERYFPNSKLFLELASDPEVEEWAEYLVLSIASGLEIGEALQRLREAESEWWDVVAYSMWDKILLDVE